jgi:hypothetical protein
MGRPNIGYQIASRFSLGLEALIDGESGRRQFFEVEQFF